MFICKGGDELKGLGKKSYELVNPTPLTNAFSAGGGNDDTACKLFTVERFNDGLVQRGKAKYTLVGF